MARLGIGSLQKAVSLSHTALRLALYRIHGLVRDTVTIQTRQGRLTIPTRDDGIAIYLVRNRQYEYDSSLRAVRFLKAKGFIPRENACMLDIGANIGVISTGLLLANEIQNAVAVEPEPKNFSLLAKNVEQNGLSERVRCLQLAAADRATTLTMELSPTNPGDHRIRATPTADATERLNESSRLTAHVQALPLGQILERPEIRDAGMAAPSLWWIDVQGYEGHVFAGAKDVLGSGLPTVSEIWPYGILRAGMSMDEFASIVRGIWSDYWLDRGGEFTCHPVTAFDRYLHNLGNEGPFENVIFTKQKRKS
jgi:FkbM family methyltransferase